MNYEEVLGHFLGVHHVRDGEAMALCPAHGDREASLSIGRGANGRTVLNCFAGCATADVLAAVELSERDLFADERPAPAQKPRIVATYPYHDAGGSLRYEICRFAPKDFRPRRRGSDGRWLWNLTGVERIPYRLPELSAAPADVPVFVVEGEKDVDALAALGLVATTNPGGCGSGKLWDTKPFLDPFVGRDVVIIPDKDPPGEKHAAHVAMALGKVASSIKVMPLAQKDASDWLAAQHSVAELRALVAVAPLHVAEPVEPVTQCLAGIKPEKMTWLWTGRLAVGKITVLDGAPGSGKSTMTCDAAARVSRGLTFPNDRFVRKAGGVIFVAGEDGIADTVVPRLLAAGADLSKCFVWPASKLPYLPDAAESIVKEIKVRGAKLLVLDPVTALFARDLSSNSDQDVRLALTPLAVAAEELGCCVLLLRHLNKRTGASAFDRGGGSVGIGALARVVLLVARDHSDPDLRIVATVKANLTRPPRSLQARIVDSDGVGRVEYGEECDTTADALVAEPTTERRVKADAAEDLIESMLADGCWHRQKEIDRERKDAQISYRTLERARAVLGVQCRQQTKNVWEWRLPPRTVKGVVRGGLAVCRPEDTGGLTISSIDRLGGSDSQAATPPYTPPSGALTSARAALPLADDDGEVVP